MSDDMRPEGTPEGNIDREWANKQRWAAERLARKLAAGAAPGGPSDRLYDIGMKGCGQATLADVVWLFGQVSRQRELLADAAAALAEAEQRARAETLRLLEEYGDHDFFCSDKRSYNRSLPCQCGYDDALRALSGRPTPEGEGT